MGMNLRSVQILAFGESASVLRAEKNSEKKFQSPAMKNLAQLTGENKMTRIVQILLSPAST
jgi:hypothetical protein